MGSSLGAGGGGGAPLRLSSGCGLPCSLRCARTGSLTLRARRAINWTTRECTFDPGVTVRAPSPRSARARVPCVWCTERNRPQCTRLLPSPAARVKSRTPCSRVARCTGCKTRGGRLARQRAVLFSSFRPPARRSSARGAPCPPADWYIKSSTFWHLRWTRGTRPRWHTCCAGDDQGSPLRRAERSLVSTNPFMQPQSFHTPGLAREVLLQQRAAYMRFHPTPSEAALWRCIRGKRLGVSFRRQVVIGNAIVDFLAPAARLIVEVDGDEYHASRTQADVARDRKLVSSGYRVLRLPASLVLRRLGEAVARVAQAL